jgi:hypothetical protein
MDFLLSSAKSASFPFYHKITMFWNVLLCCAPAPPEPTKVGMHQEPASIASLDVGKQAGDVGLHRPGGWEDIIILELDLEA